MVKDIQRRYVADFETTTDENDCRVWAWGIVDCETSNNFVYGNTIEGFIDHIQHIKNPIISFHNLKFDGEFIISYLLHSGYELITEPKEKRDKTFLTVINDANQFYKITIFFRVMKSKVVKVDILDSLKLIPMPVEKISKAFGLEENKLHIDYTEYRPYGHILTQEEVDYLKNDVVIVSKALHILYDIDLGHMTIGGNAFKNFKETIGGSKMFKCYYPPPIHYDSDIRLSYRGGYTYVNDMYAQREVGEGIVLDVNSLYPYVLYTQNLPIGEAIEFEGKYEADDMYPLYVQKIRCCFDLKEGYLPTIQIKNTRSFIPTEYVKTSNGESVMLYLTNIDLELFFNHYDVYAVEYFGGWKFMQSNTMFIDYIDHWMQVKMDSTINHNAGMRTISKLMLNSLYGKFGTNPILKSKIPILFEGDMHYIPAEDKEIEPVYIPVAIFTTSYARRITITSAQKCFDRFLYADTDSLHLLGKETPEGIEVDDVKLGAWKLESEFDRGKYLRSKCYIEELNGELNVKCCGMPSRCYTGEYENQVTFENFNIGAVYEGKLSPKKVDGGVVLKEVDFTIRI